MEVINKFLREDIRSMQFLNRDFYAPNNVLNYIDVSMQAVINRLPAILGTKEYLLYFYIREDFNANLCAMFNTNIDIECLGFSVLHRNTRHAIEAFLDLLNLSHDLDYLSVLEHCADRKKRYNSKYHSILQGKCTIHKKYEIATQMYNENIPHELVDISSETNNYTHPNVFIELLTVNDYSKKSELLRSLLNASFYTLINAYVLLLQKFNNNTLPTLGCCNAFPRDCMQCFRNEQARFQNLINNSLTIYSIPFQNPYYQ